MTRHKISQFAAAVPKGIRRIRGLLILSPFLSIVCMAAQPSDLQRGIALARENKLAEAEAAFDAIPPASPEYWQGRYLSAVAKAQLKKYAAAREVLSQLLARHPNHKDGQYLMGMVLEEYGEHRQAESRFRKVTSLAPSEPRGWLALGRALELLGRRDEALSAWQQAETLAPADPLVALRLGSHDYQSGRYQEAIPRLLRAWQANTRDLEAASKLAACYAVLNDSANLSALFGGLSADTIPEVDQEVGLALLRSGAEREGFGYLMRGAQARPSEWRLQRKLADALFAAGLFADAEKAYAHCLTLRTDDGDTVFRLGRARYEDRRISEALEQYEKAVRLIPGSSEAWFHLGIAHRALAHVEEAERAFEKALRLRPKNAETLYNLGILAEQAGKTPKAESLLLRALQADEKHYPSRFELGRIWIGQEKWEAGLEEIDRVLVASPSHSGAHYQRAMALMRLGRAEEANQALQRFQALEREERERRKVVERKTLVQTPP